VSRQPLAVALVHHPVLDKRGDLVTTAVTNLDLHDIARSAATFGVARFYVVTPVAEQQRLTARLVEHWTKGHGASYNPDRAEALARLVVVATLEEALRHWQEEIDAPSQLWLTGAKCHDGMELSVARGSLEQQAAMLVLGTGWGLAPQLFTSERTVLKAIRGAGDYNHLPVRAAAAIMFDRLCGETA